MSKEELKNQILEIWHNIATDKTLQVGLRLKATEYEAKALGLIGTEAGIIEETPQEDKTQKDLEALTIRQLEGIAKSSVHDLIKYANAQEAQTTGGKK